MDVKKSVFGYIISLLLSIVPFFAGCVLYESGYKILLVFFVFEFLAAFANNFSAKSVKSNVVLNFILLVSCAASIIITNQLYYHHVSSDSATLEIGKIAVIISVIIVLVLSGISICKKSKHIKQKREQNGK